MRHISGVGKGNGFSEADEQAINNIIVKSEQVVSYCSCDYKMFSMW